MSEPDFEPLPADAADFFLEACRAHFRVVRTGIELILDDKIADSRKRAKAGDARKDIARLHKALKDRARESQPGPTSAEPDS